MKPMSGPGRKVTHSKPTQAINKSNPAARWAPPPAQPKPALGKRTCSTCPGKGRLIP